jgi:hypothetical protein
MPVMAITSDSVPRSRGRHSACGGPRFMIIIIIITLIPSDADAVLGCHFENLLFQNHLRQVVITGGNLGSSGGFLLYKS